MCELTYAGKVENPIDLKHKLLFMSPEMLLGDEIWRGVVQNPAFHNHLIVDEAHCVKQWLVTGTILHMHA